MVGITAERFYHLLFVAFLCFHTVYAFEAESDSQEQTTPWMARRLATRQDTVEDGRCTKTTPCKGGECCNGNSGYCGLRPEHCDLPACVSNCEAKPECGVRADTFKCPLNVCCSYHGSCGYTEEFCTKTGNAPCQGDCDQPASSGHSQGDVRDLVIGYYESWTVDEGGCRVKPIEQIRVDSLTHLNVAFGYIKPSSFIIHPMEPATEKTFNSLTNLKSKAPGLQIWLSLGGWTFSDNGTDTQPVFADLSSTPTKREKFINNLVQFMREWGFDGVDIDWEYPGAPDRGGNKLVDTANYVDLLKDMRNRFDIEPERWGISFAAPTSLWYLRWFDLKAMMPLVSWVNLMSYDLHGSWDDEDSYVGNYVNSHTNLTEIKDALNLLWRNDVPANKVNLGIGFYGRTFTLSDPKCSKPGCRQKGPGNKGECTGTEGVLSYAEITKVVDSFKLKTVHDEKAAVKYMSWSNDQWIAFDDTETLQEKVKFANDEHLGGLMIWAVDLDDSKNSALDALLKPDGLGKFATRNGVKGGLDDWVRQGAQCQLGACAKNPICEKGFVKHGHDLECPKEGERRNICCDARENPLESSCEWNDGENPLDAIPGLDLGPGFICSGATCKADQILMVSNDRFWVNNPNDPNGGDARCLLGGKAQYCCKAKEVKKYTCAPLEGECFRIGSFGQMPDTSKLCPSGKKYLTYSQGDCEVWNSDFQPICCDNDTPDGACFWPPPDHGDGGDYDKCLSAENCGQGQIRYRDDVFYYPEAFGCAFFHMENAVVTTRPLCCDASKLSIETDNEKEPVPLNYLFPDYEKEKQDGDKTKFNLQVNSGKGGASEADGNAFGFIIMSGPEKDLANLDKRDGSHWELFDCETHAKRQTVKAVCTDNSPDSNCGKIYLGQVAETVVELPPHCGAGRYAVAVDLVPSANNTLPRHLESGLRRRGITRPRIYDFTFDYDFSPIHKRAKSDVLLRIDYSSEPGYWQSIVDEPGEKKRDLNELHEIVKRDHGGSWPDFLHHSFRKQKRETPPEKLDELHKRWFSSELGRWLDRQREVDVSYEAVRHKIAENYRWTLYDESIECVNYRAYLKAWVDLDIDVEITAVISLIGDLADLNTWKQPHVLFRTKGGIVASLNLDAYAELFFTTGPMELFGAQNFGLTFYVPGIVTIGPNLRVIGELSGTAALHLDASVKLDVVKWDYTQRYPNKANTAESGAIVDEKGKAPEVGKGNTVSGPGDPIFKADVTAYGALTAAITPRIEFGIVFDYEAVPDTTISMALHNEVTLYGDAGIGLDTAPWVCYGMDGRTNLYAQVLAPSIFGFDISDRWNIFNEPFDLIKRTCPVCSSAPC